MFAKSLIAEYKGHKIYLSRINGYYYTDDIPFETIREAKQHIEWITVPDNWEIYELNKETIIYN